MNNPLRGDADMDRRAFIVSLARWVSGCALVFLSGLLVIRSRGLEPGERCARSGLCEGCARLSGCVLPQAESARRGGLPADGAWRNRRK